MKVRSESGSILLIFCIVLGMIGLIGGAYFLFGSSGNRDAAPKNSREAFQRLQTEVEGIFQNQENISWSIERNPNAFSCLHTVIGDCQNEGGLFVLYNQSESNNRGLSQLRKDMGLTTEGVGCLGFPSTQCPLRVEASWAPICAPGRCENTKSITVKLKVLLADNTDAPEEWVQEKMFSPTLKLSQAVTCERGGGVWAATECLTPDQAAQRRLASSGAATSVRSETRTEDNSPMRHVGMLEPEPAKCPDYVMIQEQAHPFEVLDGNRVQVRLPAMNGCPAEDTHVFECRRVTRVNMDANGYPIPETPNAVNGEWLQVETAVAPACDADGNPIGADGNRL